MTEREDFAGWEEELRPKEFITPDSSIETARLLQEDIFMQPWEDQLDAGINALRILSGVHYDVTGKQFFMNVASAWAIFDKDEGAARDAILAYGRMWLSGTAGHYTLSTHHDQCTLMLQVFEPRQRSVEDPQDWILTRLPVPLSVPVAAIDTHLYQG